MTREEAIRIIEEEIHIDVRCCTHEDACRFEDALRMAISALREQAKVVDSDQFKTNADHIRSMTDEEMETELLPLFEELCEDGIPSPEYMWFWLKQPYKEET